jgi:hypothetical protein
MMSCTLDGPRKSAIWLAVRLNWLKLSKRLTPTCVPTEAGMVYVPPLELTLPLPKLPSEITPAAALGGRMTAGERNALMPAASVVVPLFCENAALLAPPRFKMPAASLPRPRGSR